MSEPSKLPLRSCERKVLALIADGYTNAAIGHKLDLPVDTVMTHVRHIYEKLGANGRANAVLLACRAGVLK